MRSVRRAVLLCVLALGALVSCGIPATGVVEAGGPAHGIVPMVRIYLVGAGSLVAVPRRPASAVDAESAVKSLLEGPTQAERAKRLTTLLPPPPPPTPAPSVAPRAGSDGAAAVAPTSAAVSVDRRGDRVLIQLHYDTDELADLAVAQLVCTAAEAQRTADFASANVTVTVTVTDGLGRSVEGTDEHCPDA